MASKQASPDCDRVVEAVYVDAVGSLDYQLYVSPTRVTRPPLFVMLHGAGQSASDFALGTRMHEAARECGGIALFPEQSRSAHPFGSWNWYDVKHQLASGGEPSMLAGLTRQIIRDHAVDPARVYVAGMSAGGAMAMILGQTHPELFAAIGVHSGIATGVAHDLMSALRAMNSGPCGVQAARLDLDAARSLRAVPTIVFHGDRDRTVHPLNAEAVLAQALNQYGGPRSSAAAAATAPMNVLGSRAVTLVRHARRNGRPDAEMWMVHGGGHAWTGGSAKGSFTDESGPDASREMLRFFLRQSLARRRERKVA
ncbi:alpha/beta hydrolase family esterase [Ramlibacter rhizophilus]|nr:PHB depolymerase family esterase [Ramlibacter rhizophilus]